MNIILYWNVLFIAIYISICLYQLFCMYIAVLYVYSCWPINKYNAEVWRFYIFENFCTKWKSIHHQVAPVRRVSSDIINHIFLYTHIYGYPFPQKQTEKATIKRLLTTNERPPCSRTMRTDKSYWTRLTLLPYPNTWISGLISLHSIPGRKVHFVNR